MKLLNRLKKEELELGKQIELLEKRMPSYPDGSLHVSKNGGSDQFYLVAKDKNKNSGKKQYIKKENMQLAVLMAQRDYESKLLKNLKARQAAVRKIIKTYEAADPEKIFESQPCGKQRLIKPIFMTKEEYVKRWQTEKYAGKPFEENMPEIYTARGERVRSKSEKIIADTFLRLEIPYRYEYPLELKGLGRIYPDFMVLNAETREEFFWEHLGIMDDEKYVRDALLRIRAYEKNGYIPGKKLLFTFETKTLPLDMKVVDHMIEEFLL